ADPQRDGRCVQRAARGSHRESERREGGRRRARPSDDDVPGGTGPTDYSDAGPASTLRRADLGDAVPRAPRRGGPPLRGPRRQKPLGRDSKGDSAGRTTSPTSIVPPRLRWNPRVVLPRPGSRASERARLANPEGPHLRFGESGRAREWPTASRFGEVVREPRPDAHRRARSVDSRRSGHGVEGDAPDRGDLEGPCEARDRAI